jgi:hypothetical protein
VRAPLAIAAETRRKKCLTKLLFASRSFLQAGIPESLKYGIFADKMRPYIMHAIKPARRQNGSVPIQTDGA